jgi:hypothetical protein
MFFVLFMILQSTPKKPGTTIYLLQFKTTKECILAKNQLQKKYGGDIKGFCAKDVSGGK